MRKDLVIGASGQVGAALVRHLREVGREVVGTYQTIPSEPGQVQLDIRNPQEIRQNLEGKYDTVFIAASTTNVDECEKNPDPSYSVNVEGVANILEAISAFKVVYFSTDYVFDGKNGPYKATALVNPIQKYGLQKYIAERTILDSSIDSLIVRTNMVYGPDPQNRNYSSRLRKCLEAGNKWNAFNDEFVTPTFNKDLCETVVRMLSAGREGVWHVAGKEWTTRYDFSVKFAQQYGFDSSLVVPVSVNDFIRAPRPVKGGLKCYYATRSCSEVFSAESL